MSNSQVSMRKDLLNQKVRLKKVGGNQITCRKLKLASPHQEKAI